MTKQNDKIFGISQTIDNLAEQRRRWEEGTYAASNEELYALLGNTLDLYIKVRADFGLAKAVTSLMDTYDINYNSSTTLAVKIVRLIFEGKEREGKLKQRIYSYARVLSVATENRIVGATLAKFIADNNGIEEIRRVNKEGLSEADKAKQNKDYAETVLSDANGIMQIEMKDELQPADGEQFSLALIRKNTDGTGTIVFGTDKLVPIKTVLTLAGSQLKEQASQTEQAGVAKRNEEQRKANLKSLSQEMEPQSFQPALHVDVTELNGAAIPAE